MPAMFNQQLNNAPNELTLYNFFHTRLISCPSEADINYPHWDTRARVRKASKSGNTSKQSRPKRSAQAGGTS